MTHVLYDNCVREISLKALFSPWLISVWNRSANMFNGRKIEIFRQLQGEQMMTNVHSWVNYPFKAKSASAV